MWLHPEGAHSNRLSGGSAHLHTDSGAESSIWFLSPFLGSAGRSTEKHRVGWADCQRWQHSSKTDQSSRHLITSRACEHTHDHTPITRVTQREKYKHVPDGNYLH